MEIFSFDASSLAPNQEEQKVKSLLIPFQSNSINDFSRAGKNVN